ncbi:MAG: acyltransferase, partial [Pseudomonadota bacterium]
VFTQVELMEETYRVSDLPVISLLLGILGALAVITAAALVARGLAGKVVLKTLSHMGGNSIVIYLAFFVPMVVLREVGLRLGLIPDHGTLSLLTTIVAVGSPLIGYWIIKKIGFGRFLFERSSWASIDENSRPRRAALTPAE